MVAADQSAVFGAVEAHAAIAMPRHDHFGVGAEGGAKLSAGKSRTLQFARLDVPKLNLTIRREQPLSVDTEFECCRVVVRNCSNLGARSHVGQNNFWNG